MVAKSAKLKGLPVTCVATLPFTFEGNRRMERAEKVLEQLRSIADDILAIHNEDEAAECGGVGLMAVFREIDRKAAMFIADALPKKR